MAVCQDDRNTVTLSLSTQTHRDSSFMKPFVEGIFSQSRVQRDTMRIWWDRDESGLPADKQNQSDRNKHWEHISPQEQTRASRLLRLTQDQSTAEPQGVCVCVCVGHRVRTCQRTELHGTTEKSMSVPWKRIQEGFVPQCPVANKKHMGWEEN